ncbi:GNAT family N-acetyltransferase [Jatrophihabitans sp. YIM 134969]
MHAEREALHDLMFEVFDDMTEADWEHALGGLHATIWDTSTATPLAHAAVVQRRLLHGGRALRAGYVEAVAVRASHRRRGLARRVMTTLDSVVERAYEIGGLGATDEAVPLYESLGWRRWEGTAWALTPDGVVETPDDAASIFVLPVPGVPLDLSGAITADWRDGDVW